MPHHGGIAAKADERKFSWMSYSLYAEGKQSGERYELRSGVRFPEPVTIVSKLESHDKVFRVGDHIVFSPSEAFDIANSLKLIFGKYVESAYDLIRMRYKV